MTFRTLLIRSLRFRAGSHAGTVAGAAIATAALVGALVVGDSLRGTLRERALQRLGRVDAAMVTPDRTFSRDLAKVATRDASGIRAAAVLQLPGTASKPDGAGRANRVNIFGIDNSFAPQYKPLAHITPGGVVLNGALASQLQCVAGDTVVLRVQKPSALSMDAAISTRNDDSEALRLKVLAIAKPNELGNFSLRAGQLEPLNTFVELGELGERIGMKGKANLLLAAAEGEVKADALPVRLNSELKRPGSIQLFGYELRTVSDSNGVAGGGGSGDTTIAGGTNESASSPRRPQEIELRTDRVFLDDVICKAAEQISAINSTPPIAILSYLANLIELGTNTTPYSVITAAGPPYTPADLKDNEIILTAWLAQDLHARAGDKVALSYFDPDSGARLEQHTNAFVVREVVPFEGVYDDRTLMPDFPGIENAESTQDWNGGFPLVYKIRPKDEDYWKRHKGTPKAFVSLAAGQKMWGNRFGNLTAIRWPVASNAPPEAERKRIDASLVSAIEPAALGFQFTPVRRQALEAVAGSQDFGQLFIGFSLFLIASALLLMALLFRFSLEQRTEEGGILLAVGWQPKKVRRMLLGEGAALALCGGIIGAALGVGYAAAILYGLTTIWKPATQTTALVLHVDPGTVIEGALAGVFIAIITIWITLRKQGRQPARALLAGSAVSQSKSHPKLWMIVAVLALASGFTMILPPILKHAKLDADEFFSAGSLMLIAGIAGFASWLGFLRGRCDHKTLTLEGLAVRGASRRTSRSVTTATLLACGCFVIAAIGVFRQDASIDATDPKSGTGGFALVAETTLPVAEDLNSPSGQNAFGLSTNDLSGAHIVQCRVREGDDASCLNLNSPQQPRLLGVDPTAINGRFSFVTVAKGFNEKEGWGILEHSEDPAIIPAIADANSIEWSLHKSVGDILEYPDENGQLLRLKLVGAIGNSILQGGVLISEKEFVRHFPNQSGHRYFLIDAPHDRAAAVSETLSRALEEKGLEVTTSAKRLNEFNAVQNTYLGTFEILGGLGLLIGSAGLGIIVSRNVLERRGELALMSAVGFKSKSLRRLVLGEHAALLFIGLAVGLIAAAAAVLPPLISRNQGVPWLTIAITLAAVLANGLIWTWIATMRALRGNLLAALRNE